MTATLGLSIAGEIHAASFASIEAAVRPVLERRMPGDPRLEFRYKDEWDELRIYATGFDMMVGDGLFSSSLDDASLEDALALFREISASLGARAIHHHIEIDADLLDGTSTDTVTLKYP